MIFQKKVRLPIILLVFSIGALFAQAPDTQWTRTYGGGSDDGALSVIESSAGDFVLTGVTASFGGGENVYVIRTKDNGDSIWTKVLGGTQADGGTSIQETFDGAYIIAGTTDTSGSGYQDVYLVKMDSLGDTLWTKVYGGTNYDMAYEVQQTSDSGFVIVGYTQSFGAGAADVYMIKTDSLGNAVWAKVYGGANNDYGWSVKQTADGGFIVGGVTYSFGQGTPTNANAYLIRTDANGDTIWTNTFGGFASDACYELQMTPDNGHILTGGTWSFSGGANFYVVRTDSMGDTLWTRIYGGVGWEWSYAIAKTSDEGFVIAGATESFGAGGQDAYLVRINGDGDTLWTKTCGFGSNDFAYSVQQTSDGGYIIAGDTRSYGAGEKDVWLIKLESEFPGIEEEHTVIAHGKVMNLIISPNPFRQKVNISFEIADCGLQNDYTIEIFDASGQLVKSLRPTPDALRSTLTWDGRDDQNRRLPSGVYFIRFQADDFTSTEKVVLLR